MFGRWLAVIVLISGFLYLLAPVHRQGGQGERRQDDNGGPHEPRRGPSRARPHDPPTVAVSAGACSRRGLVDGLHGSWLGGQGVQEVGDEIFLSGSGH